ncbi:MAG: efflux RND transporter permease subunit [Burkholderiaceae bacterium]
MFRWIIASSLNMRYLVLAAAIALVGFGGLQLRKMPVDVFPEFAPPIVQVQTEALGLSAEEVQGLITLNLEELLSGVPWLKSIRSESVPGLSSILMTFERGTDILKARQMIQERLTLAYTLPNVASPPVILQPMSATSRFMMVGLSSDKVEATELSLLARWTVKPRLQGVPGVANVAIWGQRLRQLHVQIDPNRLRDARVTQEDIIAATGDSLWVSPLTFLKGSSPGTGGWIDNKNQRLGVQHAMPIERPEDMAKVAVAPMHLLLTGKALALGEVAEVSFSHPPLIGDSLNKSGNGLMIVIEKFPSANTLEVTRGVDQALAELSRGLPGVQIDANVFRLASYVNASISNLSLALLAGAVLVVGVVLVFLRGWRSALVSVVAIPLSLLAAAVALYLLGATLNTMVLAGLVVALSVIIDDAIIGVDKLTQRLRERKPEDGSMMFVIYETVAKTRGAAAYATLIIILAVVPVFVMGGVAGAFFTPLALAYVLAVLASTLVALTVTPALSLLLARGLTGAAQESHFAARIRERYEAALQRVIAVPNKSYIAAGGVVLVSLAVLPLLGQTLLPTFKERELLVNGSTAPGTSRAETHRIATSVSKELRALPGVRSVGGHVGRAISGDQVVGVNSSQIWVGLDPNADYDKTIAAIRETIDGYPGVEHNLQSYLRDKVSEVLTGANRPIVVRIYGQKLEVLRQKAEEVRLALAGIKGIVDLHAEGQIEEPTLEVKVDLEKAGHANVKPGDVRRATATVFSGLVVGFLFKEQKIYEVVVHGAPEARQSMTNLSDLWVEKSDRQSTRLGDVAKLQMVSTPSVIRHEAIAPYVDVVASVAGRDFGSVMDEVEDRLDKIKFPLEYHPEILGEYAERQSVQRRMLGVGIACLIGIFLLLQACFRSWAQAAVGFLAIPVAAAGGVLAVALSGGVMSLGSIIGFLAVLGIAARNAVLLISAYHDLEKHQAFDLGAVLRGSRERLAPMLASSAATIGAMLPIIVFGRVPGLEIVGPTAIVILGGVVASTLFTLFVLPALYSQVRARAPRQPDLRLAAA